MQVLQLSEFRERRERSRFFRDMLIARVTGAQASPATPESASDPRNPIAPCDAGYSGSGSNTGSGRALHRDALALQHGSYASSRE